MSEKNIREYGPTFLLFTYYETLEAFKKVFLAKISNAYFTVNVVTQKFE